MTPERIAELRAILKEGVRTDRPMKNFMNIYDAANGLSEALDEIEFLQGRIAFLEQLMNSAVDTVVRVKTLPVQVYDHGRMAPGDKYVEWSAVREALGNDDPEIVR
jgi:hypothetical protein